MFKKIISEFKQFAIKGNVLDMAIGIIIGANFSKIVDSVVNDILMPPLGLLLGKVDFVNLFVVLKDGVKTPGPYESLEAAKQAGAVSLNIGVFLNTIISFTIVAFAVFLLIKVVNTLRKKMEQEAKDAPVTTKKCPFCCSTVDINATKCPNCTSNIK